MKITLSQLKRIIKEELGRMLKENYFSDSELSADFDNIEKAFGQLKDMIRKDPTLNMVQIILVFPIREKWKHF